MTRPNLAIIFTGGTISMTHAAHDGSAVPTLGPDDICSAVPQLHEFDLDVIEFSRLPGPHVTLETMLALHLEIQAAIKRGARGVVVTHGTDTLEETAFVLDILHQGPEPIVLVGAMRTKDELSWDGPVNLYAGCLVAACEDLRGQGVVVVMNNTINAAAEVTKSYTEALDTFVSPEMGPLGIVDMHQVVFYRPRLRRFHLPMPSHTNARVEVLYTTPGSDDVLVRAAAAAGAQGLVIIGLGRGNLPPAMAEAVIDVARSGLPVVLTTRCWGGRVAPVYGYAGAGSTLRDAGVILSPWFTPGKIKMLLMLALGLGYDREKLGRLFSV